MVDLGTNPAEQPAPHPVVRTRWGALRALYAPVTLLVLGSVFMTRPAPLWWLGLACLATAVALGWPSSGFRAWLAPLHEPCRLGRLRVRPYEVFVEGLCIALIAAVGLALLGQAIVDRPVNGDHAVHFFKAWQLKDVLLPAGELRGFSQLWYAGYPANYLYPWGADLFVVGVHALLLGIPDFGTSYGIALWLMWCLYGYSAYAIGKGFGSRWVGLAAALLLMTDPGGSRAGGWQQAVIVGVWPQTLAVALSALAVARIGQVIQKRSFREVALFGLLLGAALCTHPSAAFLAAVATPAALVVACGRLRRGLPTAVVRLGLAFALAGLLGSAYILPFASAQPYLMKTGVAWQSATELGEKLLSLDLITGMWPMAFGLGLLGTLAGLVRGSFLQRLAALIVVVFLALAAGDVFALLHLDALFPGVYSTQFERYLIPLKPFLFALGVDVLRQLLVAGSGHVRRAVSTRGEPSWVWHTATRAALAFGVTFLLAPFVPSLFAAYKEPLTSLERASRREPFRSELIRWANRELPRDTFHRIGIDSRGHADVDLGTELEFPTYKLGSAPAILYKHRMAGRSTRLLEALNVRYVVTDRAYSSEDFSLVRSFGPYKVYELERYNPQPFVVEGEGAVEPLRFERELIELRAAPGATGKLRLNVSEFSRWHATRNGHPVPITAQPLAGEPNTAFMTVPLSAGLYRFEFRPSFLDRLGTALGLLGLFACLAVYALDTNLGGLCRTRSKLNRLLVWLTRRTSGLSRGGAAVLLALLFLAVPALALWKPPLRDRSGPLHAHAVVYDFFDRLPQATVTAGGVPCELAADGLDCGRGKLERRIIAIDEYEMRKCIVTTNVGGRTVLDYGTTPTADALVGFLALPHRVSGSAELRIFQGSELTKTLSMRRSDEPLRFDVPIKAEARRIRFELSGASSICVNAQLVRKR
jgi:hypothetical protein